MPEATDPAPPPASAPERVEASTIATLLRRETVGGVLLLVAAALALVWANTPASASYFAVRDTVVGPEWLLLDLSLRQWASDGLLAVFFFVAGLELKREFVAGDLRDPRRAAVPVAAAVGGMLLPALLYLAINALLDGGSAAGWAVPTATDIAFALAVLAVISTHLPTELRTFLLALAVVDDLLAIIVIAVAFTADLDLVYLAVAAAPLAAFAFAVRRGITSPLLLVPLGAATWVAVHASGVHATVAGVVLALTVPVLRSPRPRRRRPRAQDTDQGVAEHLEHLLRPLSAGVAVPVFAFFAAGLSVGGAGILDTIGDPVTLGVIAGLVVGKPVGILVATVLMSRVTGRPLSASPLSSWDLIGLSALGGVGFTVSLLIGDLAFGAGTSATEHVTFGVLSGSVLAALIGAVILRARNRTYRRWERRGHAGSAESAGPGSRGSAGPGRCQANTK